MAITTFRIRPSEESDRDSMLALARSLDEWFNAEGLARMERDLAHHRGFVAVDRDRMVGFVTWRLMDSEGADLSWLAVSREHHRLGGGTALLQALVERLRSDGVQRLQVSTVADSLDYEPYTRTRAFYRARGFKDFRVDRDFMGPGTTATIGLSWNSVSPRETPNDPSCLRQPDSMRLLLRSPSKTGNEFLVINNGRVTSALD